MSLVQNGLNPERNWAQGGWAPAARFKAQVLAGLHSYPIYEQGGKGAETRAIALFRPLRKEAAEARTVARGLFDGSGPSCQPS